MALRSQFCKRRWCPNHDALCQSLRSLSNTGFLKPELVAVISGGRSQKLCWCDGCLLGDSRGQWGCGSGAGGVQLCGGSTPASFGGACCWQMGIWHSVRLFCRGMCVWLLQQGSEDRGELIWQLLFSLFSSQPKKKKIKYAELRFH